MLEKTAATLEPCGFQRVLPGSRKSPRVARQLHTAFWQHGAANVELTNAWQALMHGTAPFNDDSNPEQERNPGLRASAFLLDFLYPTGAIALMRRLAPNLPERPENFRYGTPFSKITPRLYTSSTPRQQTRGSKSESESESVAGHEQQTESQNDTSHEGANSTPVQPGEPPQSLTSKPSADDGIPAPGLETNEPPTQADAAVDEMHAYDHEKALADLLVESKDPEDADRVWYHYRALNEQSQAAYLNSLLLFLSKTGRLSDSWKISELFHKLDMSNWSEFSFIAGITAEVNLQNLDQALGIFIKGLTHDTLDTPSLVNALDLLLAIALRSPTTDFLRSLWKHYPEMAARLDFEEIMSQLRRVASVPGLADKAIAFQAHMIEDPESKEHVPQAFETLQKVLVRRALVECADDLVIPVLRVTDDPMAFEQVLKWAVSRSRRKLGTEVYQIYRQLPGCTPSRNVLYEMFRAYKTMNVPMYAKIAGFELLWGDWYKFYGGPSRRAYQKYLAFYASRGNKEQVHTLWAQYLALPQEEEVESKYPILSGDDTFAHILQVHAVLGEADETQRIFDDISAKFGFEPSTFLWNILLNAYAKAGDYDGAIDTFDKMADLGLADKYSYGTMMQMSGRRGDLGFTVDLYRRARRNGIRANDAILSSLIDAYCQNGHFSEAQDVCVRSAENGIVATRMWNKLLYYHALRRDLGSLNNVLNIMAERDIPYNEFTYQQLLLGLSLSRQSQHALRLLAVSIQDQVFKVTPEHFYIVMGALLRTGEPGPVKRLHKLMKEHGFPSSSGTLFRFAHAIGQWTKLPPNQRYRKTATEWLGESLRAFYRIYGLNGQTGFRFDPSPPLSPPRRSGPSDLLKFGPEQYQFGAMVYMFTQFKDLVRSRELIDLYRYVFQDQQDTDGILPVAMLNAVMAADLLDKRYDRVRSTWQTLFKTAKVEARSKDYNEDLPHTPKISPLYQYILSGGIKVMQEAYFEEENPSGLKDLFRSVLDAGFLIDSKNWNYYIQALVQLKQYKEAFVACETMLMPNWTGWFVVRAKENVRNRLPVDVRRMGNSPRYLRPVSATLYRLAQGYMELDRLGPWSLEATIITREINEECVQVVRAVKSMIRVHSELESQIFGPAQSMDTVEIGPVDEAKVTEAWQEHL